MAGRKWLSQGLSSLSTIRDQLTEFTNEVLQDVRASEEVEEEVIDFVEAKHHIRVLRAELDAKNEQLQHCTNEMERLKEELSSRREISATREIGSDEKEDVQLIFEDWTCDRPPDRERRRREASMEDQFSPTSYEIEIRKLNHEVEQLRAECCHWKDELQRQSSERVEQSKGEEIEQLKSEIALLRKQLDDNNDHHLIKQQTLPVVKDNNESATWVEDWGISDAWDDSEEPRRSTSSSVEPRRISEVSEEWRDEMRKIQEERDLALEELDREHQEAICQMMVAKESLAKTCDELQQQNECLLQELSTLRERLENRESDQQSAVVALKQELEHWQRKYDVCLREGNDSRTAMDRLNEEMEQLKTRLDNSFLAEEYWKTQKCIADREATIEELKDQLAHTTRSVEEDSSSHTMPTVSSVGEALLADLKTMVHSVCKMYNLSEAKELEMIKVLSVLKDDTVGDEHYSSTWQWLTQKTAEGNGGSLDVKTLQSSSTNAESMSARLSDEFVLDSYTSLQQSQSKAIEDLNERNHELSAKLKKAEELSAYQSTVISFLRQSVDAGFKELCNTLSLLDRYRYYVGRTTANSIESVGTFPLGPRNAIEYPQHRSSMGNMQKWFDELPLSVGGNRKRRRARSVGAVVYRPRMVCEMDVANEAQSSVADVHLLHRKMVELQKRVDAMKLKEVEHEHSLSMAQQSQEEEKLELMDQHRSQMAQLSREWENRRDEDVREALSCINEQLAAEERCTSTLKSENGRLLGQIQTLQSNLDSAVSDQQQLQQICEREAKEKERLMAIVNQKHEESVGYYQELQNVAALIYGQRLADEVPKSPLLVAVEAFLQDANSAIEKVAHLQSQVDNLTASLVVVQQQLTEKESRLTESDQMAAIVEQMKVEKAKSQVELERLKNHLLEMEEVYSQEACRVEDRETDLRKRLQDSEQSLTNFMQLAERNDEKLSVELKEVRNQLIMMVEERDAALVRSDVLKNELERTQKSLSNLQNVLESFQREKQQNSDQLMKAYNAELATLKAQVEELTTTNTTMEDQLRQQTNLTQRLFDLQATASNTEEAMSALKLQVAERDRAILTMEKHVEELRRVGEGKIDRDVIKNLLMGYFTAPQKKKTEVVHLLGSILGFSKEEFNRVEGTAAGGSGWLQFLTSGIAPSTSGQDDHSLIGEFVKFLENESSPQPSAKLLPLSTGDQAPGGLPSTDIAQPSAPAAVVLGLPVFSQTVQQAPPSSSSSDYLKQLLSNEMEK